MARRYQHRITQRERVSLAILYGGNRRDAFSHSAQCDAFLSVISSLPGGVAHTGCRCWCHSAQNLFNSPEPEYDLTPPPEYATSADRAFQTSNAALQGVRSADAERQLYDPVILLEPDRYTELPGGDYALQHNYAGQFPNRSRKELATGKCDTCGDALAKCECVE